jgi:hypothetical protein
MNRLITITIMCFAVIALANINYEIPFTSSVPDYDGVIGAGEWDDALAVSVSYEDFVINGSGATVHGTTPEPNDISGTYYFKWDQDYLYMAFDVTDDVLMWRKDSPGPYNAQDAVQLCFNPYNNASAVFQEDAWIFDIVAETADSYGADIYRHTGAINVDPNMIESTLGSEGYTIEIGLKWSDIKPALSGKVGDVHGLGLIILDFDGSTVDSLITDFGDGANVIGEPTQWNTMSLVGADGCGSQGLYSADINRDCYVDLLDYSFFATQWLGCTDPENPECID